MDLWLSVLACGTVHGGWRVLGMLEGFALSAGLCVSYTLWAGVARSDFGFSDNRSLDMRQMCSKA